MLPCHSCFIYGTWRSKEVGGVGGGGGAGGAAGGGGGRGGGGGAGGRGGARGGGAAKGGTNNYGRVIPLDTMIEKESARSAFLKIFQIVSGKLFRRMPVGGCFGYSFQVSYDSLAKAFHIDFNPYDIA